MDLGFSESDRAFQAEVRAFVRDRLPDDLRQRWRDSPNVLFAPRADTLRWQRILHERGWGASNWPREHGGPGWTVTQRYIFDIEVLTAGAPPPQNQGLRMIGPVLMRFGSPAQQKRFLPPIPAGEEYWCQGYSEPGSGSDLASLQTRAVADGEDYVLNGSKIWTTCGHEADWMFLLVRTDASGRKQDGITFLLLDMRTPGITVRPLPFLTGVHEFNQVFLDDVRVPQANRIGREGQGWEIAKYLLEYERGGSFSSGKIQVNLDRVRRAARWAEQDGHAVADEPAFKRRLAALETRAQAVTWTELRMLDKVARGERPGPESSLTKVIGVELWQEIAELGMQAVGYYADPFELLGREIGENEEPAAPPVAGAAAPRYFNYRAGSVMGGAHEIQRSVLAKAVLRL